MTDTIAQKLQSFLHLFRVATLINPFYIRDCHPPHQLYRELISSLEYFRQDEVDAMVEEIDVYAILVDNLPHRPHALPRHGYDTRVLEMKEHCETIMSDTIAFWIKYKDKLPNLYKLCHYLIAFPPSSASVERVFSVLQRSFGDKQTSSLEDYVTLSVMYQCNDR